MLKPHTRYPGAQPFSDDELSRKTFFGRERESADLANKILANRLVVVYAKSGLGKTSLLNAGVAQRLRSEQYLPLIARVNDVQSGPFTSVLAGILTATKRQAVEYVPGSEVSSWDFFKTAEFWQGDLLLTPVLILDQFEEIFTLQSAERRAAFLSELSSLVRSVPPSTPPRTSGATKSSEPRNELTDAPPALRIVLSLREDFLGCLEEAADWIPQILDHRFRLTPLPPEAAAEAMTGPAGVEDSALLTKPFRYDPETVSTIISHLSRRSSRLISHAPRSVEPFQLQVICQRIERIAAEQQQRTGNALTLTMKDIGGEDTLKTTLQDFYKQELGALRTRRQRRAVRRLCEEYLISPEGRRFSLEEQEIQRQLKVSGETLGKLVDGRLLRSDQRADSTYYELSHDTLVEPVLATSRARRKLMAAWMVFSGLIVLGFGALYVLAFLSTVALLPLALKRPGEPPGGPWLFALTAILSLAFASGLIPAGLSSFRSGVLTFRRYSSRR